jgi:hypothetical protein
MNKWLACLIFVATMCIIGCSPDGDDLIYTDCQLTRISQPGDTSFYSTRFYYNPSGLLTQIKSSNREANFRYETNKVIQEEANFRIEFIIGGDSVATHSIQYTGPGDPVYTVNYYYNPDKYLTKAVGYLDGVLWDSTMYTVTNGNVTQTQWHQHNSVVDIVNDYSYHADKPAKLWIYTKLGGDFGYFYYPWLGKPNKNLMKGQKQGTFTLSDYQYELNTSGFISKIIYTSLDSSPPYTVEQTADHNCK